MAMCSADRPSDEYAWAGEDRVHAACDGKLHICCWVAGVCWKSVLASLAGFKRTV